MALTSNSVCLKLNWSLRSSSLWNKGSLHRINFNDKFESILKIGSAVEVHYSARSLPQQCGAGMYILVSNNTLLKSLNYQ